jgi:hypothetical protein
MPRPQKSQLKSQVVTLPQTRGFVASAQNVSLPSMEERSKLKVEGWQAQAWTWYDTISEFRYSCDWVGNVLSKAILTVMKDGKPAEDQHAKDALALLFGSPEGRQEALRQFGIHFTVAGEAYIISVPTADGTGDDWMVVAATEVKFDANGVVHLDRERFESPLTIRLWRPHPRLRLYSNSPARAVLPVLSELNGLTQHVAAQIDSRLAGAGVLLLPSEISFSAAPTEGEEGATSTNEESGADKIVNELMGTMAKAIKSRSDPSALVPIVLQVAGEFVDKVKHVKFWSDLDEHAIELRNEAIRRLALGMDMPPEVLEGQADLNHWSSWQVEEAAIKSHTEPLLAVITSSLTTGYLVPYLMSEGGMTREEAELYSIGADTAGMRVRPNRSEEAMELFDRGLLSVASLLRENGFDPENDLMGDEERKVWFLRKVALGQTTPEIVAAALRKLEVPLEVETAPADAERPAVHEARPTPSLRDHPDRGAPSVSEENDALTSASIMAVDRALERAGNRLRSKMGRKIPGVGAAETYQQAIVTPSEIGELLADAWGPCDRYAGQLGVDPEKWIAVLDSFTRKTIESRAPIDVDMLALHLKMGVR